MYDFFMSCLMVLFVAFVLVVALGCAGDEEVSSHPDHPIVHPIPPPSLPDQVIGECYRYSKGVVQCVMIDEVCYIYGKKTARAAICR